jgi:hypothetical protein
MTMGGPHGCIELVHGNIGLHGAPAISAKARDVVQGPDIEEVNCEGGAKRGAGATDDGGCTYNLSPHSVKICTYLGGQVVDDAECS